jgi:hypothetical protein
MTEPFLIATTRRAAMWLGLPEDIVRDMPHSVQEAAAREGVQHAIPDWLTKAVAACEIGSPGESARLWRLLYAVGHLCQ